jgi:hypothetical protein
MSSANEPMPDFTPCPQCGHDVPSTNMRLHQLRCRADRQAPTGSSHQPQASASSSLPEFSDLSLTDSSMTRLYPHFDDDAAHHSSSNRTSYGGLLVSTLDSPPADEAESYPPRMPSSSRSHGMARWACNTCTFENAGSDQRCEMCDTARAAPMAPLTSSSAAHVHSAPQPAVSPLPPGWDCPRYAALPAVFGECRNDGQATCDPCLRSILHVAGRPAQLHDAE